MSFRRYCIIGFFVVMLMGCKKENNSVTYNSIIYKEFVIDHSKINNDTAFYSANSDSLIDIVVTKHIDTLGGTIHYSGTIYSLQDKILFTYMRVKPDYAILDTNDIIINSDEFEWMDTIKYAGSMPYIQGNTSWPYGVFLKYFGFQVKTNASNNNYGWFHLEFFVIKQMGYNAISNRSIRVGQKK
jgi:hypothetical protein